MQQELDAAKLALLWLVLPGLLALVVLAGAMLWMARRTHRYVNLPLAGATLAVLVGLVAGWVVLAGVASRVDEVRDRALRRRAGHRPGPRRRVRRQGQGDASR